MKKIKKFLSENEIELKYKEERRCEFFGGACFYNDGSYWVDVYQIGNTEYFIHHKTTGRPEFRLYKNDEFETMRGSQRDFCEVLNDMFIK